MPLVESQFRFRPEALSPVQSHRSEYSDLSPIDRCFDTHGFREYPVLSGDLETPQAEAARSTRPASISSRPPPARVPPLVSTRTTVAPPPTFHEMASQYYPSYVAPPEKPEKFGGEKEEDVDEFLTTMNVYLRSIHIPQGPPDEMEKYKVVILHRYLIGRARIFWHEMSPTKKINYEMATTALRQRFPVPNHEIARLDGRNRAIMEFNNLTQGNLTGDEYVERVQDIYAKLGDDYALSLATRFVDGINDRMVQIQVDGQLKGMYTPFQDVIQAYLGCTATMRRREAAVAVKAPPKSETSQGYEHVIRQMGEMFKSLLSSPNQGSQIPAYPERIDNPRPGYQPIVGAVNQAKNQVQPQMLSNNQYQGYTPTTEYILRPPAQPPVQQTVPLLGRREYKPRPEVVCFRCGERGYRAYECVNIPLSKEEQDKLRNGYTRTNVNNPGLMGMNNP